jgi:hypothetical protein
MMLFAGIPGGETTGYKIFTLYVFWGDLVEPEDTWFGLFEEDSGYELRMVEIELTPGEPPMDEWERPGGTEILLPNEPERPLILVSSSEMSFTDGSVPTAFHQYRQLPPDTSIILDAAGVQETRLFTTEEGLFLSDNGVCQCITDTYPGVGPSAIFIGLVWAGDLDRDGMIDLIIDDVDDDYTSYRWKLYLSSEAEPGSIVRMVASFYDVYY